MALAALNPPSPHPMQLNGEHLLLAGDVYVPITELGRGKSAVSYLYQQAEGHSAQGLPLQLVLKRYCSTPNQTIPFAQALEFELCSYLRLQQANIAHPQLLGYSPTGTACAR